ncbi:MAG TPA: glycoside hydrolase family 5 protein [Polyangiaceae bacterium]|nr:glycoside hydrolase family 5 protein [Polyangiaceae bacterium]
MKACALFAALPLPLALPPLVMSGCAAGAAAPSDSPGAPDSGAPKTTDAGNAPHDSGPSTGSDAGSSGGSSALGPYHTQGAQILDKNNQPHLFRGLDRPSLEWSCSGDQVETDYITMHDVWHANVVRLPLNQDCWINDPTNPSYDSSYEAVVDEQVGWAKAHGMDIILDLHWSDKGSYSVGQACLQNNTNCQQDMADAHSVVFWQQVATKYKNDPSVLFELYNEPRIGGGNPNASSWDTWLNGGMSSGFPVHGMQELYDTVRATGANNLVIIGGLDWSFNLTGLATNHAVTGTNIVYNTHVYNQDGESNWYNNFGQFAATYPIIATEFGDHSGSCSPMINTDFTNYANGGMVAGNAPANKLSWTAWAFYYMASNVCTFPELVNSDQTTPNAMGQVVQAALIAGP